VAEKYAQERIGKGVEKAVERPDKASIYRAYTRIDEGKEKTFEY